MTSLIMIIFIIATLIGNSAANKEKHKDKCNIFMAPSLIKERDQQGYGLGLFTGKILFEGQDINWNEVLLPFYDSSTIDANHPPLREYLWPGNMLPEFAFVSSEERNALWYSPGVSAIAPCSTHSFNLRLSGPGAFAGMTHASSRSNLLEDDNTPPRTSPKAGSYSYHHLLSYEAARTIMPGEELILECSKSWGTCICLYIYDMN